MKEIVSQKGMRPNLVGRKIFRRGKNRELKLKMWPNLVGGNVACHSHGDEIETDEIDVERHRGKKQSAVMNEQNQQSACKVFDERSVRKEPTIFMEKGECSKTAEARHRVLETANVSKGAIVGENYDSNDSGVVYDEENTLHVDDIEPNFVYENACAETDASCAFGNDGERSKTIDSDNIIRELVVREPTKDKRDMKLRRIKTKDAIRLFQTFKKFGVVTKVILGGLQTFWAVLLVEVVVGAVDWASAVGWSSCWAWALHAGPLLRAAVVGYFWVAAGRAEEWVALSLLFHWTEVGQPRWAAEMGRMREQWAAPAGAICCELDHMGFGLL
ncbi:UNVERIFIED_CONTAM: hypothetical protein Sradi_0062800 [Sesamum radiatum]|uniref:Uncharacterized protein n=1 Tax=Sesamum radiatum TaxID=300843 RepID=A0AAW2WJH8_SESRA